MSLLNVVLAQTETIALPLPTFVYGLISLVTFAALGVVVWSYRDVANRHQTKAKAYADSHGGARANH